MITPGINLIEDSKTISEGYR